MPSPFWHLFYINFKHHLVLIQHYKLKIYAETVPSHGAILDKFCDKYQHGSITKSTIFNALFALFRFNAHFSLKTLIFSFDACNVLLFSLAEKIMLRILYGIKKVMIICISLVNKIMLYILRPVEESMASLNGADFLSFLRLPITIFTRPLSSSSFTHTNSNGYLSLKPGLKASYKDFWNINTPRQFSTLKSINSIRKTKSRFFLVRKVYWET